MLKIAHISDLHFCKPDPLVAALRKFSENAEGRFGTLINRLSQSAPFDIHIADSGVVEALGDAIHETDPDVVIVSGDITTFGDEESFDEFAKWSRPLANRIGSRGDREWVVVPGNHDALSSHLTYLYHEGVKELPAHLKPILWLYIRKLLRPLRKHLGERWEEGKHLKAFGDLVIRQDHLTNGTLACDIPDCPGVRARIIPFTTTCSDPVWMNLGETRRQDWVRLKKEIKKGVEHGAEVKIVVAHHNPMAPASGEGGRFGYGYNGMPEGTEFLSELQRAGVDLILYGHQHEHGLLRFDLEANKAGHAIALGSSSSTSSSNEGVAAGGFNMVRISDPNNGSIQRFVYSKRRGFVEHPGDSEPIHIHLERNRPVNKTTLAARYEMKYYLYPALDGVDEEVFGPVKEGANGIVYMSGRHFNSMMESKFEELRPVLDTPRGRIRFLVTDPGLAQRLSRAEKEEGSVSESGSDLWGRTEVLQDLAAKAQRTRDAIETFVADLEDDQASRINVRVAHTLLPFGAYARDPDKEWGSMGVKALPIGGIGDIHPPALRLNRRVDRALYDFYLNYLKYLFLRGRTVCGGWNDENDLREHMDEDLLKTLPGSPQSIYGE